MLAALLSPAGRWIAGCVLIIAALTGIYAKGYSDGKAHVQAKWDSAIEETREVVDDAVRGAADDVRSGVRDRYDLDGQ